jgi:hypothetical protein
MANFSNITTVLFPREVLVDAYEFLRKVGVDRFEAVVLFAGTIKENTFSIHDLYIPEQRSYKTPHGLMYQVSNDELSILDDWLFERNLFVFCQMHTHPEEAYHSTADDDNCIVTSNGSISIVVPYFAKEPISIENWAVYRLARGTGWTQIPIESLRTFIQII